MLKVRLKNIGEEGKNLQKNYKGKELGGFLVKNDVHKCENERGINPVIRCS